MNRVRLRCVERTAHAPPLGPERRQFKLAEARIDDTQTAVYVEYTTADPRVNFEQGREYLVDFVKVKDV